MVSLDFKDLMSWVEKELEGAPGVVAGFSGSYSSAVGMALLKRSFKGTIDPTFVCAKDDAWRMDMAEAWLQRLAVPGCLRRVILNETVDDLEDQIPEMGKAHPGILPAYTWMGLETTAQALNYSLVWFGDRNVVTLGGLPVSRIPCLAPLSRLTHQDVRRLGNFLSVDDKWLATWDGVPERWYVSESTRYQKFDRLVGWVQAHREDLKGMAEDTDWEEGVIGGSRQGFRWMGWVPEDTYDRVTLSEIVGLSTSGRQSHAREFRGGDQTQLLNSGYKISLTGAMPKGVAILGSIRAQADTSVSSNGILLSGILETGEKVSLGISIPSDSFCAQLLKKLEGRDRTLLPVHLIGEEGEEMWYLFSLSEEGMRSFRGALEDILSYLEILPEEVIDRDLTSEELQERTQRSRKLLQAPRPTSRRRG